MTIERVEPRHCPDCNKETVHDVNEYQQVGHTVAKNAICRECGRTQWDD